MLEQLASCLNYLTNHKLVGQLLNYVDIFQDSRIVTECSHLLGQPDIHTLENYLKTIQLLLKYAHCVVHVVRCNLAQIL